MDWLSFARFVVEVFLVLWLALVFGWVLLGVWALFNNWLWRR